MPLRIEAGLDSTRKIILAHEASEWPLRQCLGNVLPTGAPRRSLWGSSVLWKAEQAWASEPHLPYCVPSHNLDPISQTQAKAMLCTHELTTAKALDKGVSDVGTHRPSNPSAFPLSFFAFSGSLVPRPEQEQVEGGALGRAYPSSLVRYPVMTQTQLLQEFPASRHSDLCENWSDISFCSQEGHPGTIPSTGQ